VRSGVNKRGQSPLSWGGRPLTGIGEFCAGPSRTPYFFLTFVLSHKTMSDVRVWIPG
jgi:hypothetical protein